VGSEFVTLGLGSVSTAAMPQEKPQPSLQRPSSMPNLQSTASLPTQSVALYATPSYGSLYTDPEDLEPGPGTYDIKQSFGHQALSTNLSAPSVSLGAKHDKAWSKVMITKDHLSAIMARGTPGPGTYKPGFVEPQSRIRFGTGQRKGLSDTNFRAPGPVYEVRTNPDNPTQHIRFSKANRFDMDGQSLSSALGSTGPGQYEVSTVFDGVRLARSFGCSHRAYDRVRFPGSDKEGQGRVSTGPGELKPFMNSGKSNAFGRAERFPENKASRRAPGPGGYEVHDKPNPDMKTQSTYSFGRPAAKGRIDWKQYKTLEASMWGLQP